MRATVAVVLVLLAGAQPVMASTPGDFEDVPLITGLTQPTAVAWAPDGRIFVTEKDGRVRVASADGVLRPAPLLDLSGHVNAFSDRGLLGLALDPGFAANGHMYLLYTAEHDRADPSGAKTARLSRITVRPDDTVADPEDPETVLLDELPSPDVTHTIGTVRAAADGTMWVGVGDGLASGRLDLPTLFDPSDPDSASGKLLHVDREGRGLPWHPFCPEEDDLDRMCTKVHAKGFRNPFRFTLLPGGSVVVADVGWSSTEELDLIVPGGDYGWPCWEGGGRTPTYSDLAECQAVYAGPAPSPPLLTYAHPAGFSILSGPLYTGTAYPAPYRGRLLYGDSVTGFVKALSLAEPAAEPLPLAEGLPFPVDLELTPAGELAYVSITQGSVRRIRHAPGNKTPVAQADATPASGALPLQVRFSAERSADPDGDALSYRWSFGDGSEPDDGPTATHVYDRPGPFVARLTARDGSGASSTADVLVSPGNDPPSVEITEPADGSSLHLGDLVALRATASDPQDGALIGGSVRWNVILHHAAHTHPFFTVWGDQQVFLTTADHDADSYYEITATATDRGGVSTSATATVRPATVELRIASDPPGAMLTYDGAALAAPVTRLAASGFRASLSAAPEMTSEGRGYRFASWSNGGARAQVLAIPDQPLALLARYVAVPHALAEAPEADPRPAAMPARLRLGLDPAGRRARRLHGAAWDVARLHVALRTRTGDSRCRWWSQRVGRPASPARCDRPRWMRATLRGHGLGRRWGVALGGRRPAGRFVLLARGRSATGERFTRWRDGRALQRLPQ